MCLNNWNGLREEPRLRCFTVVLFVLVFCGGGYAAQLSGSAHGSVSDDRHAISISGWYDGDQADYEFVYLRRTAIGVCIPEENLYQHSITFELKPWSGPGLEFSGTVEIEVPDPRVLYVYQPYAVAPDGTERIILGWCATSSVSCALVSTNEAPFLRGRLELDFLRYPIEIRVSPCEEDCWSQYLRLSYPSLEFFEEVAGESGFSLIGEIVDVYGVLNMCPMADGDSHIVTKIELAPANVCGPVSVSIRTWGTVKSLYR